MLIKFRWHSPEYTTFASNAFDSNIEKDITFRVAGIATSQGILKKAKVNADGLYVDLEVEVEDKRVREVIS